MKARHHWTRLALCLPLLGLLLGCQHALVRPERLDDPAMRAWITGNFSPLQAAELSWRGAYQDEERSLPFRLDLSWCPDSARLSFKSPFGGELARLSCSPERAQAAAGSSLMGWLERGLAKIQDPALRTALGAGLDKLTGAQERGGLKVELLDPSLLPLLAVLDKEMPEGLLSGSLCDRATVAPWLWGEWIPPAEALWQPATLCFKGGGGSWTIDRRLGLALRVEQPGWLIQLDEYSCEAGVWLPGRMRLERPGESRRLVLQRREARLRVSERR